jgi:Reverse transcriptase (RNA-dependent DNA polymerase)
VSAQRARSTLDKARQLQRALYRAAKASPTRRFHALYDKMYRKDVLAKAWREVKANAGSAGVHGQTIEQIEQQGVEGLLAELEAELREGRYRPHAVRRVRIPKPDGSQRGLGIPAARDRVCQAAAKAVLEPIFEADFRDSSYGFRPKRSAHHAGEQLRQGVNRGANWIVELDIETFGTRRTVSIPCGRRSTHLTVYPRSRVSFASVVKFAATRLRSCSKSSSSRSAMPHSAWTRVRRRTPPAPSGGAVRSSIVRQFEATTTSGLLPPQSSSTPTGCSAINARPWGNGQPLEVGCPAEPAPSTQRSV